MTYPATRIKCKADYAFCVNFITPNTVFGKGPFYLFSLALTPFTYIHLWRFLLDTLHAYGIINLTGKMVYSGGQYHGRLWRRQIGITESTWHLEYTSGGCNRRSILKQRVFRPSRHVASQIRNAAAGPAGWNGRFNGGEDVRVFPGFVLPDPACLRSAWISRADASPERSSSRAQINRNGHGLYYRLQKTKALSSVRGTGQSHQTAFRLQCASPQHRTCLAASAKKRATHLGEPGNHFNRCTERYEQLRKMVLTSKEYCCQGWGLSLLIHRGFASWAYAFSKIESYQQQTTVPAVSISDKTNLAVPDTIRSRMIMTISEMVLSTLQEVAL